MDMSKNRRNAFKTMLLVTLFVFIFNPFVIRARDKGDNGEIMESSEQEHMLIVQAQNEKGINITEEKGKTEVESQEEAEDEEVKDEEGEDQEGADEEGVDEEGVDEEGADEEGVDEEIEVDCKCVDGELECADEEAEEEAEEYECECDEDDEVVCEGGGDENVLGQELYDAYCARCHGFEGDGKGDASNFTYPKPRDFTSGMYKFRSTPSGDPPTDDDLKRSILVGFPGTSMFGWEGKFSDEGLEALIEYLKAYEEETFEIETESIEIGDPPPVSDELIKTGVEVFEKAKCWECHGKYGRGDGEKGWQPNFKDDWGDKIWPTNLAHAWELRNGSTLEDLFRSISTGLDGTPMPSFYDSYSEEQRWGLSYYLLSLQIKRKFGAILPLKKVNKIPESTEDALWKESEYIDMNMEGKKVFGIPFISMITNMRIRGIYTNSKVAIMLEWMDKKPDKGDDGLPPDAVRLQFPSENNLINLWYWSATNNRAAEYNALGQQMIHLSRQENSDVEAIENYHDGVYKLIFVRNIRTGDKNDIVFSLNKPVPFSIFAYDGKNNEQGSRGAMSAVRYILLRP
jgi:DMSO reductase family type II enzyme heme b subunit